MTSENEPFYFARAFDLEPQLQILWKDFISEAEFRVVTHYKVSEIIQNHLNVARLDELNKVLGDHTSEFLPVGSTILFKRSVGCHESSALAAGTRRTDLAMPNKRDHCIR